jgi:hypothetical protein
MNNRVPLPLQHNKWYHDFAVDINCEGMLQSVKVWAALYNLSPTEHKAADKTSRECCTLMMIRTSCVILQLREYSVIFTIKVYL